MKLTERLIKRRCASNALRILIYGFLTFIIYSIFVFFKLGFYSMYVEKMYKEKNLYGQDIQVAINLLGWPPKGIEHSKSYVLSKDKVITGRGKVIGFLEYYTDNSIINALGWFPVSGCSIIIDENDKIIGFDTFLD